MHSEFNKNNACEKNYICCTTLKNNSQAVDLFLTELGQILSNGIVKKSMFRFILGT